MTRAELLVWWRELLVCWRARPWRPQPPLSATSPEDVALAQRQATLALPLDVARGAGHLVQADPKRAAMMLEAVASLTRRAPDEFPLLMVTWAERVEIAAARRQGAAIEIGHRLSNGAHKEFRWNPDTVIERRGASAP